jgi:hypothetical protein
MDGRMAEEHRRDLTTSATAAVGSWPRDGVGGPDGLSDQGALAAVPVAVGAQLRSNRTEGSLLRRPLGQHVGALLIRAGTRLGGAPMRAS